MSVIVIPGSDMPIMKSHGIFCQEGCIFYRPSAFCFFHFAAFEKGLQIVMQFVIGIYLNRSMQEIAAGHTQLYVVCNY